MFQNAIVMLRFDPIAASGVAFEVDSCPCPGASELRTTATARMQRETNTENGGALSDISALNVTKWSTRHQTFHSKALDPLIIAEKLCCASPRRIGFPSRA